MKKSYFIVTFAHSLHGRLRQVEIPHTVLYGVLLLAALGLISAFGFAASYARMALKVASYNTLREEAEALRQRCQNLLKVVNLTNEQLETLQTFATEVSLSYGLKERLGERNASTFLEDTLVPSFDESLEEYNFLKSANLSKFYRKYPRMWQTNVRPSIWPVEGRLVSHFGNRADPFHGEGAFHAGVDISAPYGTPVRAAADGVVVHAAFWRGYGRLVVIDHGGGVTTRYAHLSRMDVIPGQEIRRAEVLGAVGGSGRTTGTHVHYEVRVGDNPVNPYKFLATAPVARAPRTDFLF
jgi:murein DD-endopeptidase MepM/ murein hydrolase activator NlpD